MHSANNIGVDLIATFLPEEVVDGLYEAVELADLHVASLTLEPIAAIQLAIPEKFRLLNNTGRKKYLEDYFFEKEQNLRG